MEGLNCHLCLFAIFFFLKLLNLASTEIVRLIISAARGVPSAPRQSPFGQIPQFHDVHGGRRGLLRQWRQHGGWQPGRPGRAPVWPAGGQLQNQPHCQLPAAEHDRQGPVLAVCRLRHRRELPPYEGL